MIQEDLQKLKLHAELTKSVKSELINDAFGKFGDKVKIIIVKEEKQ